MTTQVKKTAQANYSEAVLTALVADYQTAYAANPDNAAILAALSAKYGKTIHSLRAKLSSLKVYKTATTTTVTNANPYDSLQKATKEQIVDTIQRVVQLNVDGLGVAPKRVLQNLLVFLLTQSKKIDSLEKEQESEESIDAKLQAIVEDMAQRDSE